MKKIFITGIAQGFGRFLAERFLEMGCNVAGVDQLPSESLDSTLHNRLANYCQIDLADTQKLEQSIKPILSEFQPDILINNAAIKFFREFKDTEASDIDKVIKVNFTAPVLLAKLCLDISPNTNLTVVFISSNAAYYGYASGSLYCSTKSALRIFAEALKDEMKSNKRVTIITLCPESFSLSENNKSDKSAPLTMEYVFTKLLSAIESGVSQEVPVLKFKSKLRYLIYELIKFCRWFRRF